MRLTWIVLALVGLSILGYGLYWQHRLSPFMRMQGLELTPTPLQLGPTPPSRPVNLGFAEFNLPVWLTGELVRHDDSLFVSVLHDPEKRTGLTICPPSTNEDPELKKFVRDYARFMAEPESTFFEIRKRSLYALPFSVWSVPLRGQKRSQADAILLAFKVWQTGSVTSVQLYEGAEYGVIVSHRPDFTEILLADMSSGVEQRFLLSADVGNAAELAAALVSSYRFKTPLHGDSELLPLLAATGMRHQITPKAATEDEVARLEAIAAAVHERRKQRHRASAPK